MSFLHNSSLDILPQSLSKCNEAVWNWLRRKKGRTSLQEIGKVFFVHEPIVVEDVFGAESKFGIGLKHVVDQVTHGFTDSILNTIIVIAIQKHKSFVSTHPIRFGEFENSRKNCIEQRFLLIVGRHEWRKATQKDVENDAGGPDINLQSIASLHEDFGRDISWSSAHGKKRLGDFTGESKVGEFQHYDVAFVV
jgi:hypothetical protein